MCAFLSSIHTDEKLKNIVLKIFISTTLSEIYESLPWPIQKTNQKTNKHKNSISIRRVTATHSAFITSAVTLGVNQGLSAALTAADQVLNLLLFGDLLYFAMLNFFFSRSNLIIYKAYATSQKCALMHDAMA